MSRREKTIGYLTPSEAPDDLLCRSFSIPNDAEWLGNFMGAIYPLTQEESWTQRGTLTPSEAAAAFLQIFNDGYFDEGSCGIKIPTPYWDENTGDDADDTMPAGEQIWYGEIVASPSLIFRAEDAPSLTFIDNIGIFAIAGFIAYAGLPGAAIAFVPVAKRFVLAFKQNSLGGVVKALIDFAEVAEIDTYGIEDKVANLNIVMPDDGEPHTLYVMLSDENPHDLDNPSMTVIRKRLSEDEITPPNTRWDEDCNCVQTSPDNGTTWNQNDGADPRKNSAGLLPPFTSGDPQCDAAERMVSAMHRYIDTVLEAASILESINAVLTAFLIFLPEIGIILEAIEVGLEALFAIGTTALNIAMTDTVYGDIKCVLYCNIDTAGHMSQNGLDKANATIAATFDTIPRIAWDVYQNSLGFVGLDNAAVVGTETGDCSMCDPCAWCYEWITQAEISAEGFTHSVNSTLSQFWTAAFDVALTKMSMSFTWNGVGGGGDSAAALWAGKDFTNRVTLVAPLTGITSPLEWDGVESVNGVSFGLNAAAGSGGVVVVTGIHLEGTGTRPAWSHGHEC